MAQENNRRVRSERQNVVYKREDAASSPARYSRRDHTRVDGQERHKLNVGYIRGLNINRLNDLYERGSI